MKRYYVRIFLVALTTLALMVPLMGYSAPPKKNTRSKFYDFNEQIINGEIRKPTTIYTDARKRVRFSRLLKLKKSFLPKLFWYGKIFDFLSKRLMNEKHSQRPNKEALVKAKGLLVDFQTNDKTMDPETQEALTLCLTSIEGLLDENESLWDMP